MPAKTMNHARITGALYLLLALLSGVPYFYLTTAILVSGDAAATTRNVVAHADVFRLAFVSDVGGMACWVLVGMAFYRLLKHVSAHAAKAMMAFVAVGAALQGAVLIFQFAALMVATDPTYAAALGLGGSDALVLLLLEMRTHGFLVAQVFFGLWLLPLGYLAYKSGNFPRPLGILLVAGCFSYLAQLLIQFLVPGTPESVASLVVLPAAVAELWMVGYLLIKGVNTTRAPATA
jgi:hypothetical protein